MNTALGNLIKNSPTYTGVWRPVFIEPIPLSGERITICIVAQGDDNQHKIIQTISHKQLNCLYGKKSPQIQGIIDWTVESIKHHINQDQNISEWQPAIDGIITGETRKARSINLEGIINQGIRTVASFAPTLDVDEDQIEEVAQEKFYTEVQKILLDINSNYKSCLNQKITLTNSFPREYGFVTPRYIASFAAIANSTISFNTARIRIMDLEDLVLDHFTAYDEIEMIVSIPVGFADNESINDEIRKSQYKLMEQARAEANMRNIQCEIIESALDVAHHLHKKAA